MRMLRVQLHTHLPFTIHLTAALLRSVSVHLSFSLFLRLFLVHSVRSFVRSFVLLSVSLGNNSTISNFPNKTHPITQINFRSRHKRSVLPVYYRESAVTSLYKVTILRAEVGFERFFFTIIQPNPATDLIVCE
jgi:hypothetical protein